MPALICENCLTKFDSFGYAYNSACPVCHGRNIKYTDKRKDRGIVYLEDELKTAQAKLQYWYMQCEYLEKKMKNVKKGL